MIYNGEFRLRLADKKDLPFITKLRTSPDVQEQLGTYLITNETKQERWLEALQNDKENMYMILEFNGTPVGEVRINDIDYINRSICVGGDISEEYRGNGYGQEMYNLIFKLGFDILGMHRICLLVSANNKRAIHLYEKMGFLQEGCQRQALLKNGKYVDFLMMSILEEEYRNE